MDRSRLCIFLLFISVFTLSSEVFAKRDSQTIGDVFKNIQRQQKGISVQKKRKVLPNFRKIKPLKKVNLRKVKPPSLSKFYYDEETSEAELEKATDALIADAYRLTQRFKRSRRRGELWLRLAELYLEKARLIEFRLQANYDRQLQDYQSRKRKRVPRLNLKSAMVYNRKAIQLYEWFLRDYPKDSKADQALFLLGYNYFEIGNPQKGRGYYLRLTRDYPKSVFVDESNFSVGEFYFDNERWEEALEHYGKITKKKKARLYSFALYKSSWCQYKMGFGKQALKSLEKVIYIGRRAKGRDKDRKISRIRLASEAVRDIVVFYADVGSYKGAREYFFRVVGEKSAPNVLKKLAYYYMDSGSRQAAQFVFKTLIELDPYSPNAYDYQYQIVKSHLASGNNHAFRSELFRWIEDYGEGSGWASRNSKNKKLLSRSVELIESTLRSYILQTHQTAQNSKAPYSQKQARSGYELYFKSFKNTKRLDEMHFFYAELSYEMKKFKEAATHYSWISRHRPKSRYYKEATINAVLSLEKLLPTPEKIKSLVGKRTDPVEFDSRIKAFEKVSIEYIKAPTKKEHRIAIQYRLGSLYYYYNQFDSALIHLNEVTKKAPSSKYAEYSANLILDIYNLKKDYKGLGVAADKLLAVPGLSASKTGQRIKTIKQKSVFKQAQEKEEAGDYEAAAKAYESFVRSTPQSELALKARFNAAVNFERAGLLLDAAAMYRLVLGMRGHKKVNLQNKSREFLSLIYEKTGQYDKAARTYEEYAIRNPKDRRVADFFYNAAVIQDGLKDYDRALKNYQKYYNKSRRKDRFDVLFLMGKIWEKRKNFRKAINFYEQYMKSGMTNLASAVETAYAIAHLNEKLNRKSKAKEWYKKTVKIQKNLASRQESVGVRYAAEAKFKLVYQTYRTLLAIRIPSGKTQAAVVQKKLQAMNRLKEELKLVVAYDDGDQVIAALAVQGQAFQHMASSIHKAPIPKELKGDDLKVYKQGIEKLIKPFKEQAISSYKAAIEKAFKFQAYNSWLRVVMIELRKISPGQNTDYDYEIQLTRIPDRMGL